MLLLVLNIPLVGFFVRLLSVPPMYLLPIVTMVAFVGIYSISNSAFDLYFPGGQPAKPEAPIARLLDLRTQPSGSR
ncbi:tripartite tricarboxylate transporter permease [Marinobacter algicola]|uniref:DUF112 domain-containing protein n=1 Tax=Marinobacter algicola DG893 TaxID=443152 RepID=A6F292_9GAMM|nr:tripartite tricarboxylate transporter permease [Marinobacter algicola]EDM47070.1 hypothetical protein MDG893_11794 [Marinobacter algicola DG893]